MKKLSVFLFAALAAGVVLSVRATEAQWTFDGSTLTDGDWTFNASVNGTELTVNAVQSDPGEGATLDFSKPIADGYVIVKLNPNFGAYANKANLATLVLPTEGLTTISADAFKDCTSLTSITPFLPDSVTSVGGSAFLSVPVAQDLSLLGVQTVGSGAFMSSAITSVSFGSLLKTLSAGYKNGCFYSCKNLKTVTFDPELKDATISGEMAFSLCSGLTGTMDLSGFKNIGHRPFYDYGGTISRFVLSSNLAKSENSSLFCTCSSTKIIEFKTPPPPGMTKEALAAIYNYNGYNTALKDCYTIVPKEFKDDWAPYCEGGVINTFDSTWDSTLVPKAKTSGIYLIYSDSGSGGELGDWVYDAGTLTSTNQGWSFSASLAGIAVSVGPCLSHPDESGSLDLSTRVTDALGNDATISVVSALFFSNKAVSPHAAYLTSLVPPPAPAAYRSQCFHGCANLEGEVVIPEGITSLGDSFFEGCTKLASVKLPSTLKTIGQNVFYGCSKLKSITPLFPDSVTSVGYRAFYNAAIGGDAQLKGIVDIADDAFRCSSFKSFSFGPNLKTVGGAAITVCPVTNVSFDAGMSDAKVTGSSAFANGNLKGTLDLSGFTSLGSANNLCGESVVSSIVFGEDLEDIHAGAILAMKSLTNLTFKGAPPTGVGGLFTNIQNDGDKIPNGWGVAAYTNKNGRTVYQYDKYTVDTWVSHKYRKQWAAFAKDGVLNNKTSYWAADYVNTTVDAPAKRKLMMYDWTPGLMLIIK